MTREEKVQYWLQIAAEDLDLGEFLYNSSRWLYAAFMCHQAIEKTLKAYWTATRDDAPPYIHEHRRLAELCDLYQKMTEEQREFLRQLKPMNIEARYPDYKQNISASLNKERLNYILQQTKQLQQWIHQQCSPEMKLLTLSANTNS